METLRKYLNVDYGTDLASHSARKSNISCFSSSRISNNPNPTSSRLPLVYGFGLVNISPSKISMPNKAWEKAYNNRGSDLSVSPLGHQTDITAPAQKDSVEPGNVGKIYFRIPYSVPVINKNPSQKWYSNLRSLPQVKKGEHYSDVRTAFRRYTDILKHSGISAQPPAPIKKTVANMRKRVLEEIPSKAKDRVNLSLDDARLGQGKSQNQLKLKVCFLLPEFFEKHEDLGKYSIEIDIIPYWEKYNKRFQNHENILYFQNIVKELKAKIQLHCFHDALMKYGNAGGTGSFKTLPKEEDFRKRIEELREDGSYFEIAKYIVTLFAQPIELDRRSLDALQEDISRKLRTKYDLDYRVDSFLLVEGDKIETLLDFSMNVNVVFAGQSETLKDKVKHLKDTIEKYKRENGTSIGISFVKELWFATNRCDKMPKKSLPPLPKQPKVDASALKPPANMPLNPIKEKNSHRESRVGNPRQRSKRMNSTDTKVQQPLSPMRNKAMETENRYMDSIQGLELPERTSSPPQMNLLGERSFGNVGFMLDNSETSLMKSKPLSKGHENMITDESMELPRIIGLRKSSQENEQAKKSNKREDTKGEEEDLGFIFKLPEEEMERIQKEYPRLDRREIREIYSDFIVLCEISERKKIVKQKRKFEKTGARSRSTGVSNKRSWATGLIEIRRQEEEFDKSKLDITCDLDTDVLIEYNSYLKNKPVRMRDKIIWAVRAKSDTLGLMCWENFLNFHVVLLKGKGTKRQQRRLVERLLCPGYDTTATKEYVCEVIYDTLVSNRIICNKVPEFMDAVEKVWEDDFESTGCVKGDYLIRENLIQALKEDKFNTEAFLKLLNDRIGTVEVDGTEITE